MIDFLGKKFPKKMDDMLYSIHAALLADMVCIESLDQEKNQGCPPNHTEGTSAFTKCCKLHLQNQTRSNPDTNLSSILRKLLQTKYKNLALI